MLTGTERDLVVVGREPIAEKVLRLTFADAGGGPLPSWRPGAHVALLLPEGIERQYSLCGADLGPGTWTIAVLRADAGRGGSTWIHRNLEPGATLKGRGPANHFILGRAPRYEFIAGGIGITPLLAMIAEVDRAGADWRLSYAGRSEDTMAFADQLLTEYPDRVRLYPSSAGARLDLPALLSTPIPDTQVYACGPATMIDEVEQLLAPWPQNALHVERFTPLDLGPPVRAESFEVELIMSGQTITVTPDQSVLSAAEDAGALVVASCREGTCGTCETVVLDGQIDHRDAVLSPAEKARGDRMMICVSRAAGPFLSLEL